MLVSGGSVRKGPHPTAASIWIPEMLAAALHLAIPRL
jgi:hypothetical protein